MDSTGQFFQFFEVRNGGGTRCREKVSPIDMLLSLIDNCMVSRRGSGQASVAAFFKPVSSPTKRVKPAAPQKLEVPAENVDESPTSCAESAKTPDAVVAVAVVDRPLDLMDIFSLMDESWRPVLQKETSKPYFSKLEEFLTVEYKSKTIFPPKELVFTALNLCPFHNVKGKRPDYLFLLH